MISGGFDKSGEAAPDGAEHFPVVVAKIAEMAEMEPHLASDDDLMTLTHAVDMYDRTPSTCSTRCRTRWCWSSSPTNRSRRWRRSDGLPARTDGRPQKSCASS
jgi:hypothetical protein